MAAVAEPFYTRLQSAIERKGTTLCLGLDLDPDRPSALHDSTLAGVRQAAGQIIEATWETVWGYKLNFAFFERYGPEGYVWLAELRDAIGDKALVIGDGKRGDIGSSAKWYAHGLFDNLQFDAATIHPYLGGDSMTPFTDDPARGAFVLCLTSNPGSADFQRQPDNNPLYLRVAKWAQNANGKGNLGLVVGATHPDDFGAIRETAPNLPFLVPGVGAQGGDLETAMAAGTGQAPVIITVSRDIIYRDDGSLPQIIGAVEEYHHAIGQFLK